MSVFLFLGGIQFSKKAQSFLFRLRSPQEDTEAFLDPTSEIISPSYLVSADEPQLKKNGLFLIFFLSDV